MLHSAEILGHLNNVLLFDKSPNGRYCRKVVLNIVPTGNSYVRFVHYKGIIAIFGKINIALLIAKCAVFDFMFIAEEKTSSLNILCKASCYVVFKIKCCTAVLLLIKKDVALGVDVFLHILVYVQMIGSNVWSQRPRKVLFS